MSLAVVIFDRDSRLCEELALEPYVHFRLMRKLDDYHLPMLQRLSSYSEDTAYEHHELPQLIREIRSLVRHCRWDDPLLPVLRQLRKLAEDAQHRRTALNVIGDYAFP